MSLLVVMLGLFLAPGGVQQADPAAVFAQGAEWAPWLEAVEAQRSLWLVNAAQANPPAALVDRLRAAAGTDLQLLVVADAACSDSVQSVPHIARLAALAGVPLRLVPKSAALPLLETHRTPDGRTATPTVILLRKGVDVGAWIERPAALQAWRLSRPDLVGQEFLLRKTGWYTWDRGETSMAELVALVERQASGGASSRRP